MELIAIYLNLIYHRRTLTMSQQISMQSIKYFIKSQCFFNTSQEKSVDFLAFQYFLNLLVLVN